MLLKLTYKVLGIKVVPAFSAITPTRSGFSYQERRIAESFLLQQSRMLSSNKVLQQKNAHKTIMYNVRFVRDPLSLITMVHGFALKYSLYVLYYLIMLLQSKI